MFYVFIFTVHIIDYKILWVGNNKVLKHKREKLQNILTSAYQSTNHLKLSHI